MPFIQRFPKEPLNKSAAALGGSFAATFRFENLEIHKVFLRFSYYFLIKQFTYLHGCDILDLGDIYGFQI